MEPSRKQTFYGRRQSRPLKDSQKNLLNTLYQNIKLDLENLPSSFPSDVLFEIGFGSGENLIHQAQKYPNILCIGCEPFINGVAALLNKIEEEKIENIKIFADDARLLLYALPNQLISKAFILFPDPWPKKRHHKRRIISMETLSLLRQKMQNGGQLTIATDHLGYLEWILEIVDSEDFKTLFEIKSLPSMDRPSTEEIPVTRYEKKALENRPGAFLIFKAI
ncbi:MAG: tRNA (guanosine(46)-N7)-methyltransferase TrmB [Pseudomonadota bacterium]|jgi:tRNA (guanine-N7-)-methyltransferase|nr:tRNA (guanosine(46)-N7)-methyltransferase TrmB [Alphaproteobacteria bacterium]